MILNFIGRLVDGANDSSCRRCRTPHLTSPLVRMKHLPPREVHFFLVGSVGGLSRGFREAAFCFTRLVLPCLGVPAAEPTIRANVAALMSGKKLRPNHDDERNTMELDNSVQRGSGGAASSFPPSVRRFHRPDPDPDTVDDASVVIEDVSGPRRTSNTESRARRGRRRARDSDSVSEHDGS